MDNSFLYIIQIIHANGASFYFLFLFTHIGRGIYYQSYKFNYFTWLIGILLFICSIATAFIGYVLPWGQISFWGATVITNLLAVIPYFGNDLVIWLWGGYSVDNPTLNRFFIFHFLFPFIVIILTIIHLIFLHLNFSNNPIRLNRKKNKILFFPIYIYKDFFWFFIIFIILIILIIINPFFFNDPDNFNKANAIITPIHIQPEWYFLFAYAILRSIPNKLGGVIALFLSISILFFLSYIYINKFLGNQFNFLNKILFWWFIIIFIILTWIGIIPIEIPYIQIGQILTILYFMYFYLNKLLDFFWRKWLNFNIILNKINILKILDRNILII